MFDLDLLHRCLAAMRDAVGRLDECRATGTVPRTDEDAKIIEAAFVGYRRMFLDLQSLDQEGHKDPNLSGLFALDHSILQWLMKAFLHTASAQGFETLDVCAIDVAWQHVIGQAIALSRAMTTKTSGMPQRDYQHYGAPATPRRAPISADIRRQALERDHNRCVECGSTDDLCLDHIHPWSKGGPDELDNFQILCRPCNSSKRDKTETANSE